MKAGTEQFQPPHNELTSKPLTPSEVARALALTTYDETLNEFALTSINRRWNRDRCVHDVDLSHTPAHESFTVTLTRTSTYDDPNFVGAPNSERLPKQILIPIVKPIRGLYLANFKVHNGANAPIPTLTNLEINVVLTRTILHLLYCAFNETDTDATLPPPDTKKLLDRYVHRKDQSPEYKLLQSFLKWWQERRSSETPIHTNPHATRKNRTETRKAIQETLETEREKLDLKPKNKEAWETLTLFLQLVQTR